MKTKTGEQIIAYIKPHKKTKPSDLAKKFRPHYLWDYDYDELKKTEQGRIKILERMINYGPAEGEKIPLKLVKKYWERLDIYQNRKLLLELLIWGRNRFLPLTKEPFSIK